MKLADVLEALKTIDDTLCIVAKRPWTSESPAQLVQFTDDCRIPESVKASGFEYFLEVSTILSDIVCDAYERLTSAQKLDAIIFYAENDAYPDWFHGS